jgi:enolase-phosphatase E1
MSRLAVSAVVTDIEGTTGSIAFVKDVLFPYAETRMTRFIADNREAVAPLLDQVRAIAGQAISDDEAGQQLLAWSREDRKISPLKTLQGLIWKAGYEAGELKGHAYPDAVKALRAWHAAGLPLHVYSSGSIAAQKLLFRHTAYGDLTPLFSGYFDTTTGPKLEASSYTAIAAQLGKAAKDLLFLSDNPGEIAAADRCGWQTRLVDRDGRTPGAIASFDQLDLEPIA